MPNNREWSIIIWAALLVGIALTKQDLRSAAASFLRSLAHRKIASALLGMVIFVGIEVWAGRILGLWKIGLLTDTIFWLGANGFSFFIDANGAGREQHFFLRHIIESLGMAAVLGVYINIFPLSFWAEFLLVPFVATIALIAQVAEPKEHSGQVARYLNSILGLMAAALAVRIAVLLIKDWSISNKASLLRTFLLPLWLVVGLTPYIFLLVLVAGYSELFFAIKCQRVGAEPLGTRQRVAVLLGLGLRIRRLQQFTDPWPGTVAGTATYHAARSTVSRFIAQATTSSESDNRRSLLSSLRDFSLKRFWSGGVLNSAIASVLENKSPPPRRE
jgi:hypothetical protein